LKFQISSPLETTYVRELLHVEMFHIHV
jgi:hypothetical protein